MPRREWILRRHWSEHLRSLPNLDLGQIGKQLAVRRRRQRKRQLLPTLPMLSFTLLWFQVVAHAYIAGVGPRCWSVQPLGGWSDAQKGYAISLVISWKMQTLFLWFPKLHPGFCQYWHLLQHATHSNEILEPSGLTCRDMRSMLGYQSQNRNSIESKQLYFLWCGCCSQNRNAVESS